MQLKKICLFILLFVPVLLDCAEAYQAAPPDHAAPFVSFKNNRLTVKAKMVPLEIILNQIARQAPVNIISYGSFNDPVSVNMEGVPLNVGLKKLTGKLNRAFVYETGKVGATETSIIKIFIFSRTAPERKANAQETLLESLKDKDPNVREKAAARLADHINDDRVILHLTEVMLKDTNEKVLSSTAKTLGNFNETWVKLSIIKALEKIGGKKTMAPLKEALKDETPEVREAAASALERIAPHLAD